MKYYASFFNEEKRYDVLPQIKIIPKLSDELGMYEFTLATLDVKIDFDFKKYNGLIPVSLFCVNEQNHTEEFKMYLSSYRYIRVEINPDRWQCVIQCSSLELYLQRISMPNKMITQPITDEKRSVWIEFKKIMQVYASNIVIDERLEELMNVACPELQFVKATLHEVLIALFSICKLIPKMTDYNYLSFIKLEPNGINYKLSDFNRFEISNTISEYADMLDFDIENAISNTENVATNWLVPTSDEALVNTENFYWKLPSNIYEIKKVLVDASNFQIYRDDELGSGWVDLSSYLSINEIDITDYVVSKEIYDTFKISSSAGMVEDINYKRNNLYYENNTIKGANYRDDVFLDITNLAIVNIVYWALQKTFNIIDVRFKGDKNSLARKVLIKVDYQSEADNSRVKIIKSGVENPINNFISNQNESYIDLNHFGNQKKETIDRMGNEQYVLSNSYNFDNYKINDIPNIGDTVEKDYIIYEKQMQLYENNMIVNFILAKNFVFQTGYSGLNQVKRFTSIDKQNTVVRNDLLLFNFKLEQEKENDDYYAEKILNNYGKENKTGITLHSIYTNKNGVKLSVGDMLVISENKSVADSVICHFQFETNYKLGDQLDVDLIEDEGVYLKNPIKYTDDNGEFDYIGIYFGGAEYLKEEKSYNILAKLPQLNLLEFEPHYNLFLINKDNREITSITMQFRIFGDNEKVIVYDDFMNYTSLTTNKLLNYKIYTKNFISQKEFEENKYKIYTTSPIGTLNNNLSFEINNDDLSININNVAYVEDVGFISVGVCDQYNNLMLGLNYDKRELSNQTNIKLFLNRKY